MQKSHIVGVSGCERERVTGLGNVQGRGLGLGGCVIWGKNNLGWFLRGDFGREMLRDVNRPRSLSL